MLNFLNRKMFFLLCVLFAAATTVSRAEVYEENYTVKGIPGVYTGKKDAIKARINCVEFDIEKYESDAGSYELFKEIKAKLQKDGKKLIKSRELRRFTYIISEIASSRKEDYGYLCFEGEGGAGRLYIITGGGGKSDLISIPLLKDISNISRECAGMLAKPRGAENPLFLELVGKDGDAAVSAEILEIRGASRRVLENFYENEIEKRGWKVSEKQEGGGWVLYTIAGPARLYYLRISENETDSFSAVIFG
ncbi:MAG: hypothetical protein ACLFP1_06665 [Candidatus Goldiibacteriota bacterium]